MEDVKFYYVSSDDNLLKYVFKCPNSVLPKKDYENAKKHAEVTKESFNGEAMIILTIPEDTKNLEEAKTYVAPVIDGGIYLNMYTKIKISKKEIADMFHLANTAIATKKELEEKYGKDTPKEVVKLLQTYDEITDMENTLNDGEENYVLDYSAEIDLTNEMVNKNMDNCIDLYDVLNIIKNSSNLDDCLEMFYACTGVELPSFLEETKANYEEILNSKKGLEKLEENKKVVAKQPTDSNEASKEAEHQKGEEVK